MTQNLITDLRTDHVAFSSLLTKFKCWQSLGPLLDELKIPYRFIEGAKDIWVRDFMPVQITEDKYVQFSYHPSYLKDLPDYHTDASVYLDEARYLRASCHLNVKLDGGNVIKCKDCIVLTDKVFEENSSLSRMQVITELEKAFGCELILIPHDIKERTGHADGMLRYVCDNTLLLNHFCDYDTSLRKKLLKALSPRFNILEMHFGTDQYIATSWSYVNYLQVGAQLFMPAVNPKLDDKAWRQLEEFTHCSVYPVPALGVVRIGGGLNCLSWTTCENK